LCVSPAGVADLGGMDVDVRRDRLVHKRAETQLKVRGVLRHTKRQRHTHCLQLDHRRNEERLVEAERESKGKIKTKGRVSRKA